MRVGEQHWEVAGRDERERSSQVERTHSLLLLVGKLQSSPKAPHTQVGQCVHCAAAELGCQY